MYDFLLIFQILGVFVSLFLICFVVRENSYLNSKYLLLLLVCAFIQFTSLIFEFFASNAESALVAVRIQYIGKCFAPSFLLFFVLELCKIRINKFFYWGILFINSFILICVFSCKHHNLFYTSYEFVVTQSYNHIVFEKGSVFYFFIAVRLLTVAGMMYITLFNFIKSEKEDNRKSSQISISSVIASIFILIDSFEISAIPDFTPVGFIISCIFFMTIIYRYHVFDLVQSAREIIIRNMIEAIIVVDRNFKYLESNLSAREVFPRLKYMKKGDKINRCSIIISEILKKGGRNDFELKGKYYECHVSPVYDGEYIKGYAACIFDVTESHYYTEQLIRMKDESDAANRAKSDFLANVSHEIRTPMNAIIGLSEIVLRGELNEDQRGNIKSILTSSKSLLTIINNILDLSKIESGKFEIIEEQYNIGSVLHDVYNIIKVRLHDKPIEFTVDLPEDMPSVFEGDNIRIKEILFNILGNSVKFTSEGTIKLTLEWKKQIIDDDKKNNDIVSLIMKISDTGIGIKKEDMKKLFETYNQVDTRKNRSISGTGLGLAISKNLAEMMGGYIRVESVYGEGSVFTVGIKQKVIDYKPVNRDIICKEDTSDFDEDKNSFLNEKIISIPQAKVLIVDDISVNLQVSKGLMEPYNMDVDVALNGTEAIRMIKAKDYDLVFMDHMMPNMDGVDVTKIIRGFDDEKYKKLPIIALTANALTSSRDFFIKNGFNGFLAKPIDLKQLNKVLYDFLPVKMDAGLQTDESEQSNSNTIKRIDYSVGLRNVGGNIASYYKVLKSYLRESKEMYKEFNDLIKKDIETFRIKIHGLKSSSANIGAISVSEKAKLLEMAAKNVDMEYISENITVFYDEILELFKDIHQYIENYEKEIKNNDKEVFESIDNNLILTIKKAAGNFDINTMENTMEKINKYSYTKEINEFIQELEIYIDNFEYDKCIDLINEWDKKHHIL